MRLHGAEWGDGMRDVADLELYGFSNRTHVTFHNHV